MTPHDPCRSETLELLDYAQSYEREGLLLYDEILYVEVAIVDTWLAHRAAQGHRDNPFHLRLMDRIRKAKEDGVS